MKQFDKNYIYESQYNQLINEEGGLRHALKNFWNWLVGEKTDKKYIPKSNNFDNNERDKLYNASDGKFGYGTSTYNEISDLVDEHTIEASDFSYFEKTTKYLNNAGENAKNNLWIVGAFKSKITETNLISVICCYSKRDDKIQNAAKINFIDVYKSSAAQKAFDAKALRELLDYIMKVVSKDPNTGYPCHHVCLYEKNDKKYIDVLEEYPSTFTLTRFENNKKRGLEVTKE